MRFIILITTILYSTLTLSTDTIIKLSDIPNALSEIEKKSICDDLFYNSSVNVRSICEIAVYKGYFEQEALKRCGDLGTSSESTKKLECISFIRNKSFIGQAKSGKQLFANCWQQDSWGNWKQNIKCIKNTNYTVPKIVLKYLEQKKKMNQERTEREEQEKKRRKAAKLEARRLARAEFENSIKNCTLYYEKKLPTLSVNQLPPKLNDYEITSSVASFQKRELGTQRIINVLNQARFNKPGIEIYKIYAMVEEELALDIHPQDIKNMITELDDNMAFCTEDNYVLDYDVFKYFLKLHIKNNTDGI